MSSLALELDRTLSQVDRETAAALEQAVREALKQAEQRAQTTVTQANALGYPAGYFESTAGSFANERLEAPAELPLPTREQW